MLVQPIQEQTIRPRCRARQRKGRLRQIDDRSAHRRRAAESRPARRHHRSRLRGNRASPITSTTAATGPSASRVKLEMPTHYCIARGEGDSLDANEAQEFANFSQAISAIEHTHDVVVIDTPGNDTYLMRLAHSMADTLVTPLNDSFVDFDVLGQIDAGDVLGHRREPLCRDGARGAPPAPPGRRQADRLDRGAQSSVGAVVAQQAPGRRGHQRTRRSGWRSAGSMVSPSASSIANSSRAA